MRLVGSTPDPFTLDYRAPGAGVSEPYNMDIYTQVYGGLVSGETTGVFLIYGQSNVGNYVDATYSPSQAKNHMLNIFNGGVYRTKEPVVGCNGGVYGSPYSTGNLTARLGDLLIAAGTYQRVIICNISAGGTSSLQWADGGNCNNRLKVAARRLAALGLPITRVIRHQGEQDTIMGYSSAQIKTNIWSEVDTLRNEGVTARVMVCHVSYTSGATSATVRQGQSDSVDVTRKIFLGPDSDALTSGGGNRQADNVHFNSTGAAAFATLLKNAIIADL